MEGGGGGRGEVHAHVELYVADTAKFFKVKVEDVTVDAVHVRARELGGGALMVLLRRVKMQQRCSNEARG